MVKRKEKNEKFREKIEFRCYTRGLWTWLLTIAILAVITWCAIQYSNSYWECVDWKTTHWSCQCMGVVQHTDNWGWVSELEPTVWLEGATINMTYNITGRPCDEQLVKWDTKECEEVWDEAYEYWYSDCYWRDKEELLIGLWECAPQKVCIKEKMMRVMPDGK